MGDKTQQLREIIKGLSLDELRTFVRESDDSNAWEWTLILVAAVKVGTSSSAIQKFTELPLPMVEEAAANLTANRIFLGNEIDAPWLEDDDGESGFALLLDSQVAQGLLKRVSADSAEPNYIITEKGIAKAEALIKSNPAAKDFYDSLGKKPKT